MTEADIIIIGSGIGALSVAGELCKNGRKVLVITKGLKKSCNSSLAQGGISVALSDKDNYEWHYEDTMAAGCNLNDSDAVMKLVSTAPNVIRELIDTGMEFDRDSQGNLMFGREAAHRLNRVIHAGGDRTGLRVVEQLIRNLTTDVTVIQNQMALDLRVKDGKCYGVITKDSDGNLHTYHANYVVLATGGIGQLYPSTSNDVTITGDGIAMAYRAGAKLKNLEFVQFHPTMLTIDGQAYGLVSEACRGAGGILVNEKGEKIIVKIEDNGLGIKKEEIPHLFDRFFRSENVRNKDIDGSGIGLSIAKVICDSLKYKLEVDSEYGKWTEFKISIPIDVD